MVNEVKNNTAATTSQQVVCFKIGKEEYGIDILLVQEILKLPVVTRLPKSVNYIMGVFDLRGKVVPVIDLSRSSA
jgi:purine-binding chemotaxis protein CheW